MYWTGREGNLRLDLLGTLGVEENIWSTALGLKGKLDASVVVRAFETESTAGLIFLKERSDDPGVAQLIGQLNAGGRGRRTMLLPLELKTGKYEHPSHRAQLLLYTLLMADRYDAEIRDGLMLYLHHQNMVRGCFADL